MRSREQWPVQEPSRPLGGIARGRRTQDWRAAMWTIQERTCGCETEIDARGNLGDPISYCSEHDLSGDGVYTCGECGFVSWRFERLERHVYAVHLGIDLGPAAGQLPGT
ncbi:MAG TPA: hypothetical protein VGR13_03920 [Actinomycetota bacterium]|nr:hypothetical protein [Actinomycetota bacterium]